MLPILRIAHHGTAGRCTAEFRSDLCRLGVKLVRSTGPRRWCHVRFAPIATEIRRRSESTRSAKIGRQSSWFSAQRYSIATNHRLAALLRPSAYPICYPFMEVRGAHNSLYPSNPHIISDNVAHTSESEGDTSAS